MTTKLHIALIQGGPSAEHEVSLMSAQEIKKYLHSEKYTTDVITISKDNVWSMDKKVVNPLDYAKGKNDSFLKKYSVIFNALHGTFGEDGGLQSLLDTIGVNYTGSGVLASAWGMDKAKTNWAAERLGIVIPQTNVLYKNKNVDTAELKKFFPNGCVVKPNSSGSSVATAIVTDFSQLPSALDAAFAESSTILVQEYIKGREVTCAVVGNQGSETTSYPVVEIVPKVAFYDYDAKYKDDTTEYVCPAELDNTITKTIQENAKKIHQTIGADGLTRSDFIVTDASEVYFLEINTAPGMTSHSLAPKAAAAAGIQYSELLDLLIALALEK